MHTCTQTCTHVHKRANLHSQNGGAEALLSLDLSGVQGDGGAAGAKPEFLTSMSMVRWVAAAVGGGRGSWRRGRLVAAVGCGLVGIFAWGSAVPALWIRAGRSFMHART